MENQEESGELEEEEAKTEIAEKTEKAEKTDKTEKAESKSKRKEGDSFFAADSELNQVEGTRTGKVMEVSRDGKIRSNA